VRVRLYSVTFQLLQELDLPGSGPGWLRVDLGPVGDYAPGLYYFVADLGPGDPGVLKSRLLFVR
jgi:hypothetical protein